MYEPPSVREDRRFLKMFSVRFFQGFCFHTAHPRRVGGLFVLKILNYKTNIKNILYLCSRD